MKKKRIVFSCLIVVVILAIGGGILLTRQRSLNDVLNISGDSVNVVSVDMITDINAPIMNYWTKNDAKIQSLIELLSSTQVNFSGWEENGVVSSYYDSDAIYGSTEYQLTLGNSQLMIVTPDGVVHYCSKKYTISAEQAESFLAQLSRFCGTWES